MNFQRIVLIVALAILILVLALVGFMLYRYKQSISYPPEISECPDYWKVTGLEQCENVMNIGNGSPYNMDFSGPQWQGKTGLKQKKEWAQTYKLEWDGITNNPNIK